jgi:glycosyltransferase involved in cell wall biosynthesis
VERDWILTISEATKNDICNHLNIDEKRVIVAYPAASRQLYHPETDQDRIAAVMRRLHIPEKNYFLSLATLEYRKNLQQTIRCFKRIVQEEVMEDRYLVLAGTVGWKIKKMLAEIETDSVLRQRVIMTGYVPDSDLSALYSGALAFVYPSLYEGFGLPPLEAMQCGVPVITSNTSSLPEVVGDAGILVSPQDSDALCQAMLDVAGDAGLCRELSEKSLNQAARFSWKRCAAQTVTAYREAWAQCR